MISIDRALQQLLSFEQEIPRLYSATTTDYRGRVIDAASIRRYLLAEQRRMAEAAALLPDPPEAGARLLDVGTAYGFLPVLLKTSGKWQCEGLELAENIPVYSAFARAHAIPLHAGKLGVTPLPFPDASFQAIVFSEVLEHLRLSPSLVFKELRRLLADNGFLLVTTPNVARLTNIVKLLFGRNPSEPFPKNVVTDNITEYLTHIREYTMGELRELLSCAGFEILNARYSACMERDRPHFYVTALIPPWRGNLMILARKRS